MEWRTEAKTKEEIVRLIQNQPDNFLWEIVLDANEKGDRIAPTTVGFFILAYSHMAQDVCRRENHFIENRLKFRKVSKWRTCAKEGKMTVFEQENLSTLRRLGFVSIANPNAAKVFWLFVKENFAKDFPNGLKLLENVGHYGTDNYVIHAIDPVLKRFKNDILSRIEYHQIHLDKLNLALREMSGK